MLQGEIIQIKAWHSQKGRHNIPVTLSNKDQIIYLKKKKQVRNKVEFITCFTYVNSQTDYILMSSKHLHQH